MNQTPQRNKDRKPWRHHTAGHSRDSNQPSPNLLLNSAYNSAKESNPKKILLRFEEAPTSTAAVLPFSFKFLPRPDETTRESESPGCPITSRKSSKWLGLRVRNDLSDSARRLERDVRCVITHELLVPSSLNLIHVGVSWNGSKRPQLCPGAKVLCVQRSLHVQLEQLTAFSEAGR